MEQNFQNNNLEQDFIDLNLDERPFYKKFFDFLVNPTFLFLILGILFIGFLFFSGMAIFKNSYK
jgi:membrane-bound ClpP family serine protease